MFLPPLQVKREVELFVQLAFNVEIYHGFASSSKSNSLDSEIEAISLGDADRSGIRTIVGARSCSCGDDGNDDSGDDGDDDDDGDDGFGTAVLDLENSRNWRFCTCVCGHRSGRDTLCLRISGARASVWLRPRPSDRL